MADPNDSVPNAAGHRQRLWQGHAAVVAVSLVASLPFCNKAFHVDDTLYLEIAEQILVSPLRPFDGAINWQQVTEPAWNVSISPPGFSYWLAGWMKLGVRGEAGLHLAGTIWLVVLALAVFAWARRLGDWPVAATCIVLLNPIVIAGQNLMLDVPMVALSVAAIAIYLRAHDRNSLILAVAAGVLAGLAANVKYAAVVSIGVMALDALLTCRWRMLLAVAIAVAILGLGQWASYETYGAPQLFRARAWITHLFPSGLSDKLHRTSISVVYLGACAGWLFLIGGQFGRRAGTALVLAAVAAVGAAGAVWDFRRAQPEPWTSEVTLAAVHTAVFAATGWLVVAWFALRLSQVAWSRRLAVFARPRDTSQASWPFREFVMLATWTVGFWYLGALNGPFVAPRSLLPCVVGLILGMMKLNEWLPGAGTRSRAAAVALTAAIGLAVGVGDYEWAGIYRDGPVRLLEKYRAEGRTFFTGHWGWQYYAESAGMLSYDPSRDELQPGDVVIYPLTVDRQQLSRQALAGLRQIGIERVHSRRWIPRTRDSDAYISFYGDTGRGRVPWGWSRYDLLEVFVILKFEG